MDNLLQFVRRTSRTIRKGSSVHPQEDLDNKENDATKRAIVELCAVFTDSDSANTLDEKKVAIADIGHLVWIRGRETAVFAAEKCLVPFTCHLASEEHAPLHQMILATLGELFQCVLEDQRVIEISKQCHLPSVLIQLLGSQDQVIVQWCLHVILFLCCGGVKAERVFSAEEMTVLKARAAELSVVDWSSWRYNEAEEVTKWIQQL